MLSFIMEVDEAGLVLVAFQSHRLKLLLDTGKGSHHLIRSTHHIQVVHVAV